MNANGKGAHQIVRDRYTELTGQAAWSPNGKTLAYIACTAAYLSRPCEHFHVLKSKTFSIASVDWSPDSRSLSYLTEAGGGANARLFRVGLDGRSKRLLP
jgi:Tol biopolymer transport system component